jgi:hypothetical protein
MISAIEIGIEASSRRSVRRTARAWTNGMTPITSKPAIRNPMPIYIIGSIMTSSAPPRTLIVILGGWRPDAASFYFSRRLTSAWKFEIRSESS